MEKQWQADSEKSFTCLLSVSEQQCPVIMLPSVQTQSFSQILCTIRLRIISNVTTAAWRQALGPAFQNTIDHKNTLTMPLCEVTICSRSSGEYEETKLETETWLHRRLEWGTTDTCKTNRALILSILDLCIQMFSLSSFEVWLVLTQTLWGSPLNMYDLMSWTYDATSSL